MPNPDTASQSRLASADIIKFHAKHANVLSADDILPLIASLTPRERERLLRLINSGQGSDSSIYAAMLPTPNEFRADDDLLSWDAEGWEQFI